jgi:hypothetical protein
MEEEDSCHRCAMEDPRRGGGGPAPPPRRRGGGPVLPPRRAGATLWRRRTCAAAMPWRRTHAEEAEEEPAAMAPCHHRGSEGRRDAGARER